MTEARKEEERAKARQYAELQNIEYVDPYPAEPPPTPPIELPLELSDEKLIELVNQRAGITLSNLNDLRPKPSAEEIEAQQKEREAAMLSFGLTSGKFKKEDYDSYQQTLSNKKGFIRQNITEQFTTMFPELSTEAIEEKVANYLFENLEPGDSLRQAREKELMDLSDIKIKDKFKNIVNLPQDYATYEEGINNKTNFEKKVQATLPVYKNDVSMALESLRKFTVPVVPDKKNPANIVNLELEFYDDELKEVEDLLLTNDQIIRAVKEGLTLDQIRGEAELVLMKKHLPRLISQGAKKYNATQKSGYLAGRKGVTADLDSIDVHEDNLDDSLKDVYDQLIKSSETAKAV